MTKTNDADDKLIRLYNEIDAFMRQQYHGDSYADHYFLIQEMAKTNAIVARHQQEMRAIAQLRNSIVHNPFGSKAQPIAQPHEFIVEIYANIRNSLINPPRAISIAVPGSVIYTATLDSNLSEVVKAMDENTYTHVPIMKDNKMVGVFSENTLLSYLAESDGIVLTKDVTINEFAKYIPLNEHRSEKFEFLNRNASLSQVYEIFNSAISKHERIGMLFITEHGKEDEKPLGIITAWDLASPIFNLA